MRTSKVMQAVTGVAAAAAMLFSSAPAMADEASVDETTETTYEPAAPGTTFELDELNLASEATATGFNPFVHGASTMRGDTWADPVTGPKTQTKSGVSWPKYDANEDPLYYSWGCHVQSKASTTPIGCELNPKGTTDVVVVGSSYVGQWMPAIQEIAARENWKVTIHTKTWCDFQPGRALPSGYPECDSFNNKVLSLMKKDVPDIVITSHYDPTATSHMTKVYKDLLNRGVDDVVGIWNSDGAFADEGAGWSKGTWCIRDVQDGKKTKYNNFKLDYRECDYAKGDFNKQGNKAMRDVDAKVGDFHYLSFQDWLCPKDSSVSPRCLGVIGQVVPWRNGAHLTNEWTHSMTNPLHEALFNDGVTKTRPGTGDVSRLAGDNRYETSAKVSAHAQARRTVYVTTGVDFPDALTAGAKAGEEGSAVLLSQPNNLPNAVTARLKALNPTDVVMVGSTKALSNKVRDQIKAATGVKVTRVGGAHRYQTAANLATMPGYSTGGTVYVANGLDFPDALTTSALAGATLQGSNSAAVLLAKPNAVPQDTRAALAKLKPSKIVVIGGPQAINNSTMMELSGYSKGSITRVAGQNRYETAAELSADTPEGRTVYVSVGTEFADAGSVAPIAARNGSLLLTKTTSIPQATRKALVDAKPSKIVVVGGPVAVNAKVQRDLAAYIH